MKVTAERLAEVVLEREPLPHQPRLVSEQDRPVVRPDLHADHGEVQDAFVQEGVELAVPLAVDLERAFEVLRRHLVRQDGVHDERRVRGRVVLLAGPDLTGQDECQTTPDQQERDYR